MANNSFAFENIKVEKELHTELIIKNEILDETILMEGEQITNEEEGSNDSDSVVSVKHEPVSDENDKKLYTINYENIKLEKELHTELIIKSEILDETVLEEKPFVCDICNKRFTNRYNLVVHKRIHTGEKPFSCDVCNKRCIRKGDLVSHKRIHTGEKPFSCEICNKTFSRQNYVVKHKLIHSGEKPFSCDICNKTFTQRGHLVAHKRIHTGEKPFVCDICNKRYTNGYSLVVHKRIHTREKPFSSDICNKTFNRVFTVDKKQKQISK